jgi:hypothetical protein
MFNLNDGGVGRGVLPNRDRKGVGCPVIHRYLLARFSAYDGLLGLPRHCFVHFVQ